MARPAEVMTVGGIDPNSHKIVIVETRRIDKVRPFVHQIELGHGDYEVRVSAAFDFIVDFCIKVHERDGLYPRLFLEAPVLGVGGAGSTIPQAYVSGAILAAAVQGGSQIALINNQTWKKRVTGNGNCNKMAVSEWVEENWPLLYERTEIIEDSRHPVDLRGRADQDVIDAGCINLYGWRHVKMVERLWRRRNG